MGFEVHPLIIIWGAILLLVFITSFFTYLNRRNRYRVLEKIAEKGDSLSPELIAMLTGNGGEKSRGWQEVKNPVTSGIFLMCIGIALAVFFWAMQGGGIPLADGNWLLVIGIFPFMVGLARVLGAMFEKRDNGK